MQRRQPKRSTHHHDIGMRISGMLLLRPHSDEPTAISRRSFVPFHHNHPINGLRPALEPTEGVWTQSTSPRGPHDLWIIDPIYRISRLEIILKIQNSLPHCKKAPPLFQNQPTIQNFPKRPLGFEKIIQKGPSLQICSLTPWFDQNSNSSSTKPVYSLK
jgi:hypothetical protein